MAKYVCSVCGYVHEGDQPPEKCPQCGVGPEKFNKMEEGEKVWAAEHVVGVAKGVSEDIVADLAIFDPLLDHRACHTVFHASQRIKIFQFCDYFRF